MKFDISQSSALNGVRFSTATPLVLPQMTSADQPVTHNGLHRSPKDTFEFLMMMNSMAQRSVGTQWGTAIAEVDNYRYSAEIPSFGRYLDDRMGLIISPKE